jgi:hypothetical protein
MIRYNVTSTLYLLSQVHVISINTYYIISDYLLSIIKSYSCVHCIDYKLVLRFIGFLFNWNYFLSSWLRLLLLINCLFKNILLYSREGILIWDVHACILLSLGSLHKDLYPWLVSSLISCSWSHIAVLTWRDLSLFY